MNTGKHIFARSRSGRCAVVAAGEMFCCRQVSPRLPRRICCRLCGQPPAVGNWTINASCDLTAPGDRATRT